MSFSFLEASFWRARRGWCSSWSPVSSPVFPSSVLWACCCCLPCLGRSLCRSCVFSSPVCIPPPTLVGLGWRGRVVSQILLLLNEIHTKEASGYFFCLEDRALLCRDCDVSIHTVNSFVSAHQRFLLTGVQVGLDAADPLPAVVDKHVNAGGGTVYVPTKHMSRTNSTVPSSGEGSDSVVRQNVINGDYPRQNSVPTVKNGAINWTTNNSTIQLLETRPEYLSDEGPTFMQSSQAISSFSNQINGNNHQTYNLPLSGGNGSENLPDWPVDEFFSSSEFGSNSSFPEHYFSKGDNTKLGSAGGSPQCRLAEGFVAEDLLGLVPGFDAEESWTVPEVPSPPTASGLHWQGKLRAPLYDSTMFVPQVSSLQSSPNNFSVPVGSKRRRRQF